MTDDEATDADEVSHADVPGDGPLGVVLAAGRGRRFGSATKQVAVVHGRPMVARVVDVHVAAGLPVLVVVGHRAEVVAAAVDQPSARVVANPAHDRGTGSSLAAAARAAGPRDLVVLLADQPAVPVADVHRVCRALADGAVAARIMHADGPGHPVGLSRRLHADLLGLSGDHAARSLLARLDTVDIEVDHPRPIDVDTPDDLARLAGRP